jgi:hypothetical protein
MRLKTIHARMAGGGAAQDPAVRGNDGGGDGMVLGDERDSEVFAEHLKRCDDAMTDDMWWAANDIIAIFAKALGSVQAWSVRCPCHPYSIKDLLNVNYSKLWCPLAGCIAPDLACGGLETFYENLCSLLFDELHDTLAPLSVEQRGTITDYFQIGKMYIHAELILRFGRGWASIPLRALGMGHENNEKAIGALVDCLAQYEALSAEEITYLTFILFDRRGPLREQVIAIVTRMRTWDQCPGLLRYRHISLFVFPTEVSVERKHATLSKSVRDAPFHSVAYASVHGLRKHEILRFFEEDADGHKEFKRIMDSKCRTPRACIQGLGLAYHPSCSQYMDGDGTLRHSMPHYVAADVIYRSDLNSQYMDLEPFPAAPAYEPPA